MPPEFLNFRTINVQNNQCTDYFDELFCLIEENGVIKCSSNYELKLHFQKTKLGIQSLSYVGPNTWNSLPDNLKSANSVSSFEHYMDEYFLKNLCNIEEDIYSYT